MSEKAIRQVMREVHSNARSHGWWGPYEVTEEGHQVGPLSADEVLSKIMLVVSELSEAVEFVRRPDFDPKGLYYQVLLAPNGMLSREDFLRDQGREPGLKDKIEGFGVEMADAVIRIFDLAEAMNVDLSELIELKHQYNKTREMKHGGKRA